MIRVSQTPMSVDVTAERPVEASRAIGPIIRAAADEIERDRRLPAHIVDALHEAGLFRMTVPRDLGGLESDALTITRAVEELAAADGSAAWCVLIAVAGSAVLGWLPRGFAEALATDRRLVVAGTLMPTGKAIPEDGGYRITGDGVPELM